MKRPLKLYMQWYEPSAAIIVRQTFTLKRLAKLIMRGIWPSFGRSRSRFGGRP